MSALGVGSRRQVSAALASAARRRARIVRRVLIYALCLVLAFIFALPFLWLLSSSVKTDQELAAVPPVWIPTAIHWSNYPQALTFIPYFTYLANTLQIAGANIVGALLSNTVVAYGFARLRWPGRNVVFFVVVATLMLPSFVTLIPLFLVYRHLGWINTYFPLTVPAYFGNAFFIFLLRQFFLTIPQELSDAARIDGCTELGILLRIILPLARPALAMVALFQFNWSWSDYFGPLIYINDEAKYTLSRGLAGFLSAHSQEWGLLMAATTVTLLPVIVLFFLTQRTFIEGISLTGVKG